MVKDNVFWKERVNALQGALGASEAKCRELETKVLQRVDTAMIQERKDLACALAEMTSAVSYAIRVTVGKEVM